MGSGHHINQGFEQNYQCKMIRDFANLSRKLDKGFAHELTD